MKKHIRLKLKPGIFLDRVPHWQHILEDKAIAVTHVHPELDQLFLKYQIPVWIAREYHPAHQTWDRHEVGSGLNRVYRLILHKNTPIPPGLIHELSQHPMVEEAHPGAIGRSILPELMPSQMSINTDLDSRKSIRLEEAHQFTQGDPTITIAVLDTGIDLSHPEFKDVLLPGYDFVDIINGAGKFVGDYLGVDDIPADEVGHGTHVAGIIAGKGLNMPKGVVPNCKILPVRVLGAMQQGNRKVGAGLVDNINSGIKWAIDKGADVINMSLGIRHTDGGVPHQEVVDYAQRKGVTIVAASGNDGADELYYPSALPYVIAVGAVTQSGEIAPFSTYGSQVSFVAPGTDIYSSALKNNYAFSTGTSHASPFVTGGVALLKSYAIKKRGIRLSDNQVKHLLKHTSDKIDARFKHRKAGFGKLNLVDALKLLDHKLS
jgi:hypothetical protein